MPIKEVEDQIPKHLNSYVKSQMRKHLTKEYYAKIKQKILKSMEDKGVVDE